MPLQRRLPSFLRVQQAVPSKRALINACIHPTTYVLLLLQPVISPPQLARRSSQYQSAARSALSLAQCAPLVGLVLLLLPVLLLLLPTWVLLPPRHAVHSRLLPYRQPAAAGELPQQCVGLRTAALGMLPASAGHLPCLRSAGCGPPSPCRRPAAAHRQVLPPSF